MSEEMRNSWEKWWRAYWWCSIKLLNIYILRCNYFGLKVMVIATSGWSNWYGLLGLLYWKLRAERICFLREQGDGCPCTVVQGTVVPGDGCARGRLCRGTVVQREYLDTEYFAWFVWNHAPKAIPASRYGRLEIERAVMEQWWSSDKAEWASSDGAERASGVVQDDLQK